MPLGIESSTSDWLSGDVEEQSARIQQAIESSHKIFALGLYDEIRLCYTAPEFQQDLESWTVHLGLDVFGRAGTSIFAPFDGTFVTVHDTLRSRTMALRSCCSIRILVERASSRSTAILIQSALNSGDRRFHPSRDTYCQDRSITPKRQLASAFALTGDQSSIGMETDFGCRLAVRTKFLGRDCPNPILTRNPRAILDRTRKPTEEFIGKTPPHPGTQSLFPTKNRSPFYGRGLPD